MCRMWWPLTLTYIFKVIWPWLWKSCLLCNVFSSRSIIFLIWDPIVWVIMRRRGVSSERRRSSCSSYLSSTVSWFDDLTLWYLVVPYGALYLSQHHLRQWLIGLQHQAITWTNVDWGSKSFMTVQFHWNIWYYFCAGVESLSQKHLDIILLMEMNM